MCIINIVSVLRFVHLVVRKLFYFYLHIPDICAFFLSLFIYLFTYLFILQTLNPLNARATDTLVSVNLLNSTEPDDDSLKQVPDKRFYLAMDFNQVDNFHFHHPGLYPLKSVIQGKHLYSPQINHISFSSTAVPPLTQMKDIDEVGTVGLCVWFLFSSAVLRYVYQSECT